MSTAAQTVRTGVASYLTRALTSSLGSKLVMGLTGLLFIGWLFAHLAGNLAFFGGAEAMNKYAALLKDNPPILWGQRAVLVLIVVLHVWRGLALASRNKQARPQAYAVKNWRKATFASRTMAVSGVVVLVFLAFHLAHFTWGWVDASYMTFRDAADRHDVFRMLTTAFANPLVVALYVVALAAVGLHVSHGFWSAFQSLGINGRRWTPLATLVGRVLAVGLALAFLSIPIAALLGLVGQG